MMKIVKLEGPILGKIYFASVKKNTHLDAPSYDVRRRGVFQSYSDYGDM